MNYLRLWLFLLFFATPMLADELKKEAWHTHSGYGSVSLGLTEYSRIQKIKAGMTFDELEREVGQKPARIATNPDIGLYMTEFAGVLYEVAILDKKEERVIAVSFKRMKTTEPNQRLQTIPRRFPFQLLKLLARHV